MIKLTIDEIPASLNVWSNWHWSKKAEYKVYWENLILEQVKNNKLKRTKGKVNIVLTFYFKHTLRDLDNFVIKGLIDGLKRCLIQDDSVEYIERIILEFGGKKDKNKTEIKIFSKEIN